MCKWYNAYAINQEWNKIINSNLRDLAICARAPSSSCFTLFKSPQTETQTEPTLNDVAQHASMADLFVVGVEIDIASHPNLIPNFK